MLQRLINTDFMPHGYCFLWFPEILWLHVFSDGLITLAYFMIPTALALFVWRRRELPFPWMFLMFASFIAACGLTHARGSGRSGTRTTASRVWSSSAPA